MISKTEKLQSVWHRYDSDHRHLPTSARQAVKLAVGVRSKARADRRRLRTAKTDVDVYNDLNKESNRKFQWVLDFTDDVAERQHGDMAA